MTDLAQQQHCTRPWYLRPPVWLLAFVVAGLVIFGVVESLGRPPPTAYGAFLDQLDAGNVASVTFQGTRIEGRFKHAVAGPDGNSRPQEDFRSRVPDFGDSSLLAALRKEHVAINVVSASSWPSWLSGLPWPMLLFLAFIVIGGIARLVRGDTPEPNATTAMPTHPVQAVFGLVSGMFGKKEQTPGTQEPKT